MAILVEFIRGVTDMLRDVGNGIASIALIAYGIKLVLSSDANDRENAKRMLIMILIAIALINFSDRIIEELIALI